MAESEDSTDAAYPIGSVDNALRLLELFAMGASSIRVSDVSRTLGVARSTAHRLLQVLASRGFVSQDRQTRAYLIGPALVRLAVAVSRGLDLATVARPVMAEVVETLGETVHLVVLHGTDAFFLESLETSKALRVGGRAGQSLPAYATATGRVLLAGLSPEVLDARLRGMTLAPLTERTITDRAALDAVLAEARERGYATSFGESEDEVSSVAVPVRRGDGGVIASLAIGAPPSRLAEQDASRIASTLREAAARIAALLP